MQFEDLIDDVINHIFCIAGVIYPLYLVSTRLYKITQQTKRIIFTDFRIDISDIIPDDLSYVTSLKIKQSIHFNNLPNLTKLVIVGPGKHIYHISEIKDLINLTYLNMSFCSFKSKWIKHLTNLKHLHITGEDKIKDKHLKYLTNLQNLKISTKISNDTLLSLTNLTHFYLYECNVNDNTLRLLTNLKSLCLARAKMHTDYGVETLTNLTRLNLDHALITDDALTKLTNITSLSLYINKTISNTALHKLPHLVDLDICANSNITYINDLTNLTRLDMRWISYNHDISNLTNLTNLSISDSILVNMISLTNLTKLNLQDSPIEYNISHLTKLKNLKIGYYNRKIDISKLTNLTKLTTNKKRYKNNSGRLHLIK